MEKEIAQNGFKFIYMLQNQKRYRRITMAQTQMKYFGYILLMILVLGTAVSLLKADSQCQKKVQKTAQEWDGDFDGYPNFIERAIGYSPQKDDCMDKLKCGKVKIDINRLGEQRNLLIILDASSSMRSRTRKGGKRMDEAKAALQTYIQKLSKNTNVGLLVYSGRKATGERCQRLNLVQPVQRLNKKALKESITQVKEKGLTPMAMAIERAAAILKQRKGQDNEVILISDGHESCGGNPIDAIYKLKNSPAKPRITVIGFGVRGRTKKQLECMAKVTGGKYHGVDSGSDLELALAETFKQLSKLYDVMVCLQREFNNFRTCEANKYNKARSHILNKKMFPKNDKHKKALIRAERLIDKRYNKTVKEMSVKKLEKKKAKLRKAIKEASKQHRDK